MHLAIKYNNSLEKSRRGYSNGGSYMRLLINAKGKKVEIKRKARF